MYSKRFLPIEICEHFGGMLPLSPGNVQKELDPEEIRKHLVSLAQNVSPSGLELERVGWSDLQVFVAVERWLVTLEQMDLPVESATNLSWSTNLNCWLR